MKNNILKFIHLSDIHFNGCDDDQIEVLDEIIDFLEKQIIENGKNFDFIIISGDLTQSGNFNEFERLQDYIEKILFRLDIDKDRIIIIPGNHDYNRSERPFIYQKISVKNSDDYVRTFKDSLFVDYVNNCFSDFNQFLNNISGNIPDIKGYKKFLSIDEYNICFTIINSCLFNTISNDSLNPYINYDFLKEKSAEKEECDLSILLTHHPIENLYVESKRKIKDLVFKNFDLVISGHEHSPQFQVIKNSTNNEYLEILSGCVFLQDKQNLDNISYKFSIIEYDWNGSFKIIPYMIDKNSKFVHSDTSISRDHIIDHIHKFRLENRFRRDNSYIKLENPLEKYNYESLNGFYSKEFDHLLKCESKKEILKIRKSINHGSTISLENLSLAFLNYMIKERIIKNFHTLENILKENIIIFSFSKHLHQKILFYYNAKYFEKIEKEKKYDLATKLSIEHKKLSQNKLQKKIFILEQKLENEKKNQLSFLERFKGRDKHLMPKLPNKKEPESRQYIDWYERYGLVSDPFPSKNGLENIDEDKYEQIIYTTSVINHFKNFIIQGNIDFLINKTFCIYGPFGIGKTTLFQYLNKLLRIHFSDMIVISISLKARDNIEKITRKFLFKLHSKLDDFHRMKLEYSLENEDLEENCFEMLRNLSDFYHYIIIIIEDIYKPLVTGKYKNEVIIFIRNLQNFKSDFSDTGIKTTILFSAINDIANTISSDHSLSGSADKLFEMPSITVPDAYEMLNKRFKVYAKNPEIPPKISKEYLYKLKRMAKPTGKTMKTFRDYIDQINFRFSRLEFTEDKINISYNEEDLKNLKIDLKSSKPQIYNDFSMLKSFSEDNQEQFVEFLNILEDIWLEDPIIENTPKFFNIKKYMMRLVNTDLIEKTIFKDNVAWTLSYDCKDYFDKIYNIYELYPSNLLPPLFFSKEIKPTEGDKNIIAMGNIIQRSEEYGSNFITKLSKVKALYEEILIASSDLKIIQGELISDEYIEKIRESFELLIIILTIQNEKDVDNYEKALKCYEKSWYEIDIATNYGILLKDYFSYDNHTNDEKQDILSEYKRTVAEIISKLKRNIERDTIIKLKNRKIWENDKKFIDSLRQNIENGNFDIAKQKIRSFLKRVIGNFCYEICCLLYSQEKWRRGLDESINLRLKKLEEKIPSYVKFNQRKLFLKLELRDYLLVLTTFKIKFSEKVQFFSKVQQYYKKLNSKLKDQNPFDELLVDLLEEINIFYIDLLEYIFHSLLEYSDDEEYKLDLPPKSTDLSIENLNFPLYFNHHHYPLNLVNSYPDIFIPILRNISLDFRNYKITNRYKENIIEISQIS